MNTSSATDLIDIDDAAERLGVSRPTLYRWLRSGHVKGHKVGRQWRIHAAEVDRLASGRTDDDAPSPGAKDLLRKLAAILELLRKPAGESTDPAARLVRLAMAMRASDVHIEPRGKDDEHAMIRFRIDGLLGGPLPIDRREMPILVDRFKTLANCNTHEKHTPQDGRFTMRIDDRRIDLRVSFIPTLLGEAATVVLLDPQAALVDFEQFDYTDAHRATLERRLEAEAGLILIVGPTGSGKTTTLYACLRHLAGPERRIVTIEDPVEYTLPGTTQIMINPHLGMTWHAALAAAVRAMPDVIMHADLRDAETATQCCSVAATGRLVIAQMHARNATSAVDRLLDMGVPRHLLTDNLRLVVAQRLIRKLCDHCAQPIDLAGDDKHRKPVGCPACAETGYRGRTVVTEMLEPGADLADPDMRTMHDDARRRAALGQTSHDEVDRLAAQLQ